MVEYTDVHSFLDSNENLHRITAKTMKGNFQIVVSIQNLQINI